MGEEQVDLLSDDILERSAVVANCRMNRERGLVGPNGYDRELGLNPLEFLGQRAASGRTAAWLDLCCGSGKALIEAARAIPPEELGSRIRIVGVDLVGMFRRPDPGMAGLRLVEASTRTWRPDRRFDLVTCVHGLHYIGDKLGLIVAAASWLTVDGLFVANLGLENLKFPGGRPAGRAVAAALRRSGLEYDRRGRRVVCRGARAVELPFGYVGADDRAGPNYTGQPAVDSYYEIG